MRNRYIAIVMALSILGLICAPLFAEGEGGQAAPEKPAVANTEPVKVNNTLCPVTGDPVDMKNPVTVEYEGKVYNLCCPMCIAPFKADPKKYIAKIEEQKKLKRIKYNKFGDVPAGDTH